MENESLSLAQYLGIPRDAALGMPLIYMVGNCEVHIENFKALIEYELCRIRILSKKGIICINGSCLEIIYMDKEEIEVKGKILSVLFE